jgi:hypothetical protein
VENFFEWLLKFFLLSDSNIEKLPWPMHLRQAPGLKAVVICGGLRKALINFQKKKAIIFLRTVCRTSFFFLRSAFKIFSLLFARAFNPSVLSLVKNLILKIYVRRRREFDD